MEIGVFIPIGRNGWIVSTTSPQYNPSFELNKQTTLNAERYGLDFVLSMIKLRGFGGESGFWDQNLESFTLMAGLAAITSRIKLYATVPTLVIPPAGTRGRAGAVVADPSWGSTPAGAADLRLRGLRRGGPPSPRRAAI